MSKTATRKQAVVDPKTGETNFFNVRSIKDQARNDKQSDLAQKREAARQQLAESSSGDEKASDDGTKTPDDGTKASDGGTKKTGSQTTK